MEEAEMTLQEATALAALYRRERDDVTERLLVANLWAWLQEERDATLRFMQRPGMQNGLKKVEEMETAAR